MEKHKSHKNVLIFGLGPFGLMTYNAIIKDPANLYKVCGFVSDEVSKANTSFENLPVYHLDGIAKDFIVKNSIDEIIFAVQNIETSAFFEIVLQFLSLNVTLKTIPPIQECRNGYVAIDQLKDFKIEDLLSKEPKFELNPLLSDTYDNQVILITGAAGSIGCGLVKKLIQFNYKELILLDNSETSLYDLQQELLQNAVFNFKSVIADIRDFQNLDHLFDLYKPKIVFHAAAYKHVPLMEEHPYEAIKTNVIGTKNLVDVSVKHSVNKFIFISTDKAVNPTNVMGASKRIAELYINSLMLKGQTKFIITRFGNVLASNGSVLPLFKKQIEVGGPIKVTQRDIERYFMTISEACHLILETGAIGNGGETFVFKMGKPFKIYDLAKMMVQLSGKPINIKITGLRAGEKVAEELIAPSESARTTYHPKIMVAKSNQSIPEELQTKILELCEKASKVQNLELVAIIKSVVPEYISNNSKYGVLDNNDN